MKILKLWKITLLICLICFMFSCATPGSTKNSFYSASPYEVTNEKYVDTIHSVVWDNLVQELSKSYFMINNIDKESRIINISFSTDNVSDYVDCGSCEVRVKKSILNKTGQEVYQINICDRNQYTAETGIMNQGGVMTPVIIDATRRPSLTGRMNIYIAPQGSGTLVTVNCRYIVTINTELIGKFYTPMGVLDRIDRENKSFNCSLDTKRPTLCNPNIGDSFMCHSTGKLEIEILSLVK